MQINLVLIISFHKHIQMNASPYSILQIPETASYQQIKQRYRHLSKLLHPDKQPIENYQMAQKHFKQIDEAYKAISSQLRRYVYRKYGPTGINILDSAPFYFKQFQGADFSDPAILDKLDQLLRYFMHEEHASTEIDKNKLRTRTLCLVWKPLNKINKFPNAQRSEFQFQTPIPDAFGFSNSFKVLHVSQGLSTNGRSQLSFGLTSSKRIQENWLLNLNTNVMRDTYRFQCSVDRIFSPNFVAHFIPVVIDNEALQMPEIGADLQLQNFYISALTDFQSYTLQVGTPPSDKKSSKMLKVAFQGDNLVIAPVYERQITDDIRFFSQVQVRTQIQGNATAQIQGALSYGYKLRLGEELKLELMSFLGAPQNYFQISLITPKYRVNIPLLSRAEQYKFQCYKLCVFAGVLLFFEGYNWFLEREKHFRERLEFDSYNRLSVQKNTILKTTNDCAVTSVDELQKQKKYNGLIISLAYLAANSKIKNIKKKILSKVSMKQNCYQEYNEEVEELIKSVKETILTSLDSFDQQTYEISSIVQNKVSGGHLFKFDCEELGVNPCLNQRSGYKLLILYWQNGTMKLSLKDKSQKIEINPIKQHYKKGLWSRWKESVSNYFFD